LNIYNANSRNNCWYTMGDGEALAQSLSQIGPHMDVFRAWFFQSLATTNGVRDWAAFDHTLSVARSHGVKVIATLTNQWGDCEQADPIYKTEAWYQSWYRLRDASLPVSYREWVAEVVTRYRSDPTILAWQLVNEAEDLTSKGGRCSSTATRTLMNFTSDMARVVKSIDHNHLLSLGTVGTGQCGTQGAEYQEVHSVPGIDLCEFHDYGHPLSPLPGDQWNGFMVRVRQCNALNKPLFVGETGIKTSSIGSLEARAKAFAAKFAAQFQAGVVGQLIWDWRDGAHGGSAQDSYEVGPGDPVLALFNRY
jgi:endo-1,4-beta-mannosidase